MTSSHRVSAFPFDVRPGEVEINLAQVLSALKQSAKQGARLMALPEKWTTSFMPSYSEDVLQASESALSAVHEEAAALGVCVVGSAPVPCPDGAKPFNEVQFLGLGELRRPYRKRVLFSPTGEGRQVQRGEGFPETIETEVGKVCAVVCYDLRFPEVTRHAFYQGADLLVVPAQWPYPRTAVFDLLAQARACENQMWLLACNRAGRASLNSKHTMEFPGKASLVNPMGEETASIEDGSLLVSELDYVFSERVRKTVPCARDLKKSELWPEL